MMERFENLEERFESLRVWGLRFEVVGEESRSQKAESRRNQNRAHAKTQRTQREK
jgi:hypothetical protein